MKLTITVPMVLAASLAAAGCHKSKTQQTLPQQAGASSGGGRSAAPGTQETATDDIRAALLHLQRVHFGLDSNTLLPAARDSLVQAAKRLAAHPDVHVYVDGHTDDRGTSEYNIALGDRRAAVVIDYLVRLGIARDRLHPVSYGEEHPYHDGETATDRAANRRVEFRLMRGDVQLVLDDGTQYSDEGSPLSSQAVLSGGEGD
jgi:peptidoglycan-associated lipoprotein